MVLVMNEPLAVEEEPEKTPEEPQVDMNEIRVLRLHIAVPRTVSSENVSLRISPFVKAVTNVYLPKPFETAEEDGGAEDNQEKEKEMNRGYAFVGVEASLAQIEAMKKKYRGAKWKGTEMKIEIARMDYVQRKEEEDKTERERTEKLEAIRRENAVTANPGEPATMGLPGPWKKCNYLRIRRKNGHGIILYHHKKAMYAKLRRFDAVRANPVGQLDWEPIRTPKRTQMYRKYDFLADFVHCWDGDFSGLENPPLAFLRAQSSSGAGGNNQDDIDDVFSVSEFEDESDQEDIREKIRKELSARDTTLDSAQEPADASTPHKSSREPSDEWSGDFL